MSDHTPEPWPDLSASEREALMVSISPTDYARAKACVDACAGIPTEQLQPGFALLDKQAQAAVQALIEASGAALQYILLVHHEALNSNSKSLVKIAKADFEALKAALAPFRED